MHTQSNIRERGFVTGKGNVRTFVSANRTLVSVYGFLILIFAVFAIWFPLFRSQRNIANILKQITPLAIVAIGQTIVLIGGGVDLTVGSVISLTSVLAANVMGDSLGGVFLGVLFIFAVAAFIGIVNGFICNSTNIPPLIVTLCTSNIIHGIILWYKADPGGSVPRLLMNFLLQRFSLFSTSVVIMILLYIVFSYVMKRSAFGLHVYAMGGNTEYSRMAGINVSRVRIGTYVLSALLASVAGLIMASRIASGSPLLGNPFQMDSLTASIIGGASFAGGQGIILGSFAGASIVAMMSNALNISGVSPFFQYFVKGALLIAAMIMNTRKKK